MLVLNTTFFEHFIYIPLLTVRSTLTLLQYLAKLWNSRLKILQWNKIKLVHSFSCRYKFFTTFGSEQQPSVISKLKQKNNNTTCLSSKESS